MRCSVKSMQVPHSPPSLSALPIQPILPIGLQLQLRLLGPVQVHAAGAEVAIAGRKSRALLAYLALRRGATIPRETLTGLLWGDRSEDQARASLRQTLSALRRELGPAAAALQATNDNVSLAVDGVWVDTDVLEGATQAGGTAALQAAAALFRGELLEGLTLNAPAFDAWLLAERERARSQMLRVWQQLMVCLQGEGRIEEAITHGARALAMDPFQEAVHRRLMGLYLQQGRLDAALHQFEQCRRTLAEQLQVLPDQQTLALLAEVQARRRQTAASKPPEGPGASSLQPALPDKPSIAVLPFVNMSADPEQEFFSDGISEDLITELGRYGELFVIARSSSFAFKHTHADARAIGQRLGVQYLLQGSIRKLGQRIRVTAQLVDADTATQVWANRYDRELLDIFELQDDLTRSIVSTVKGRVDAVVVEQAVRKPSGNLSAYECVLRGQALVHTFTQPSLAQARYFLQTAISLDASMARAYGWLAYAQAYEELYWNMSTAQLQQAQRLGEQGLALDANDSRCHLALGLCHLFEKSFVAAEHHLLRASALSPNDDLTMIELGRYRMYTNAPTEGADWVRRGMRQNPFHPNWYWNVLARCLHTAGDYGGAIAALQQLETLHYWHHGYLAACHAALGQMQLAHAHAHKLLELVPNFSVQQFKQVHPYRDAQVLEDFFASYRLAGLPD
jgi:TolB-like protein/DNA-binding SARP family transcriptional activator